MSETKVWFVTDLRGSTQAFKKVLNVVRHHRKTAKHPDVVIVAGNLTGRETCVVNRDAGGRIYADFRGERCLFESEEDRNRYVAFVENVLGGYQVSEPDPSVTLLTALRLDRLKNWLSLIERGTSAKENKARLLVMPGPSDPHESDELIGNAIGIELCDEKVLNLDSDLSILSLSALAWPEGDNSPVQPRKYFEKKEDYITCVQNLVSLGPKNGRWIFNLRMPPRGTTLDYCQLIDCDGNAVQTALGPEYGNVGSKVVRICLEKHQPIVSLHGFIAEGPKRQTLGKTLGLGPGSEAFSGMVCGVWLEFKDGSLIDWTFTREAISDDIYDVFLRMSQNAIRTLFKKPPEILGQAYEQWKRYKTEGK